LFASLARAVGFEARVAAVNRRTEFALDFRKPLAYFVRARVVAVRLGDRWAFCNPGVPWVPFGMLRWAEEGATALIAGADSGVVVTTPMSDCARSNRTSVADLTLSADGALEGTLRVALTGHVAIERRRDDQDRPRGERLKAWTDELQHSVGAVQTDSASIEPGSDSYSPYVFRCRVRFPGYAQRTEHRLILQPFFFRRASEPLFAGSRRRSQVFLHFPWSETDSVRIRLPEGCSPEALGDPVEVRAYDIGQYETVIRELPDHRTLVAVRRFYLGAGGRLVIPVGSYLPLKKFSDSMREYDGAATTLTMPR
jgi:hypothetical protein